MLRIRFSRRAAMRAATSLLLGTVLGCREARSSSLPAALSARRTPVPLSQAPDQFLQVGEVTIRYRVIGAGPPLVLLHGYTDRVEMWNGTADSLAGSHTVIVPDIRGFGRSSKPGQVSCYGAAMYTDVLALLDDLELGQVHVVGYSMGGLLAAQLALHAPDRVVAATLVAGAFWNDSATAARELLPFASDIEQGRGLQPFMRWILPTWPDTTLAPISLQAWVDNDREALAAVARALPGLTLDWALVQQSRVPVLAVIGTADPLLVHSRRLVSRWPGARMVEVPGGDHVDITSLTATVEAIRHTASSAESR